MRVLSDGGLVYEPGDDVTGARRWRGYGFKTLRNLGESEESKPWIIKNIIAVGDTSAWIAPPGGMKSALMTDLAFAITTMRDWHGYKNKLDEDDCRAVIYFALERADLVKRRLRAHMRRANLSPEDAPPVAVVSETINLMDAGIAKKVVETIKQAEDEMEMNAALIVFDTFAKAVAAGGGDESTARDTGRVFANVQHIKDAIWSKPHVALVGHTGKDESRGARGSNAILGDVDAMMTISGDTVKTVNVTKANDMPEGVRFSFKAEVHKFGEDEDGDPITVNIVSEEEAPAPQAGKREPRLTPNQQTMFSLLHTAASPAGLTTEEWNAIARDVGIGVNRKADLHDLRTALKSKGLVTCYGDRWKVKHG